MELDWSSGELADGLRLYEAGEFFAAHESWELVWLRTPPPEKAFLQGLIQVTGGVSITGSEEILKARACFWKPLSRVSIRSQTSSVASGHSITERHPHPTRRSGGKRSHRTACNDPLMSGLMVLSPAFSDSLDRFSSQFIQKRLGRDRSPALRNNLQILLTIITVWRIVCTA